MKRLLLAAMLIVMVAGCGLITEKQCERDMEITRIKTPFRLIPLCEILDTWLDKNQHLSNIIRHCSPEVLAEVRGYMERGEEYEVEIGKETTVMDCTNKNLIYCESITVKLCTVHYTGPITPEMKTKLKELTK